MLWLTGQWSLLPALKGEKGTVCGVVVHLGIEMLLINNGRELISSSRDCTNKFI